MKPEFIEDTIWGAIPQDVQEFILDEGARLFRIGTEPEDAFWIALEREEGFNSSLKEFFDVGNPPKGVQWETIDSEDAKSRRLSLKAMIRGYYLATLGHEEFLKIKDSPALLEYLLSGKTRHMCPQCFNVMAGSDDSRVGSMRVHHRCKPKLISLGETFWDIIDDEFQKSRTLEEGDDDTENEVQYPEFLSIFGEADD